ncbi:MAG: D-inositol-3-phosphate glycosyltransferase [Bradymonadia bacterium]
MRIAVLGPSYPYRGGIAHYTARLSQQVQADGHDLLAVNLSRQYPSSLFPGTTQEDASERTFDVDAQRWLDTMNPASWLKTARRIHHWDPDWVIVQWWHPYFAPSFGAVMGLLRGAGRRVALVCHNVEPHESSPVDRVLLKVAYAAPQRFLVHANTQADAMRIYRPGADIVVNPHPVYDQFGHDPLESDESEDDGSPSPAAARQRLGLNGERWILFFGLVRPYKGLDLLLQAMPEIHERTGARLLVAGECYGEEAPYHALAEGLGDAVRFEFRYVANEEVPDLMAASDVVVLPYRHATQSGVAQAAFGCGRAVISTRVGGIPDVVRHEETGLLVDPEDPSAIADAVEAFYVPGVRERLEAGVVADRAKNSWSALLGVLLADR